MDVKNIEIDKVSEKDIKIIFNTPRLEEMFYKVKDFSMKEIDNYSIITYMEKKNFNFAVDFSRRAVQIFVTDKKGFKYRFLY